MGIWINEQKSLQRARRRLSFCYLCGHGLPTRKAPEVSGDHVVPLSFLRALPRAGAAPLVLDVHQKCHDRKSQLDDLLCTWNTAMLGGPDAIHWRSIAAISKAFDMETALEASSGMYIVKMDVPFPQGVGNWVRGLCTALYEESFVDDGIITYAPGVEAFGNSQSLDPAAAEESARKLTIEKMTLAIAASVAAESGRGDAVEVWGGAAVFRCFWIAHKSGARCCWALSTPGDLTYGIQSGGPPLPWTGYLTRSRLPRRASMCNRGEIESLIAGLKSQISAENRWDHVDGVGQNFEAWVCTGVLC